MKQRVKAGRNAGSGCAYISSYTTVDDHRDHSAEENNNYERINQAEPMDTWIKYMKVVIPSSCLQGVDKSLDKE